MNTCDLEPEEQMYLPILIELLPQSSYICDNIKKEHTTLVEEIEHLTNQLDFNIGVGKNSGRFSTGEFQQTVSFHVQVSVFFYFKNKVLVANCKCYILVRA